MVEWMSLDEAYLDLTSRAPADARRACADIQRDIAASLCVDVAIGMAASKVVARVASRLARPRGLLYVLPGYEARLLAPLDPAVLPGLDAAAVAALKAAGVTALGELAALDPAAAAVMLGRSGPVLVRHAGAVDDQPVLGTTVPKAVGAGADVSTPDAAIDVLLRVVQMAAQDLRRQGLLARTASVTTRYPDGSTSTRCTTLRDPTSADDDLVAALRRLLPRLVRTPTPVVRLEVSLAALVRADRQLSLFGPRTTTVLPDRRHA
jgi:DNA polymerase-4